MPDQDTTADAADAVEVVDVVPTEIPAAAIGTSVAVREAPTLVVPVATAQELSDAFRAYAATCETVLDDNDYQSIGSKRYRTKSAWRKLAVAYGVDLVLVDRDEDRDETDLRRPLVRAIVTVRATAPNGRAVDGIGACDLYERCCPPDCRNSSSYHRHCPAFSGEPCVGWTHFSHAEHDLVSTAYTRAANRACADLFGLGEVSAEEMDGRRDAGSQWAAPETLRTIRRKAGLLSRLPEEGTGRLTVEAAFHWPSNVLGASVFDPDAKAPTISEESAAVLLDALDTLCDLFAIDDPTDDDDAAAADDPNQ